MKIEEGLVVGRGHVDVPSVHAKCLVSKRWCRQLELVALKGLKTMLNATMEKYLAGVVFLDSQRCAMKLKNIVVIHCKLACI